MGLCAPNLSGCGGDLAPVFASPSLDEGLGVLVTSKVVAIGHGSSERLGGGFGRERGGESRENHPNKTEKDEKKTSRKG